MAARDSTTTSRLPLYEDADQAKLRTWVQMVAAFYRIQRRVVSRLAEKDVTLPQFDVLATLRFGEGATQQELAQRLLVTKGNVCGVLDRLERLGWVERRPDPNDGRANRLYLTPAGRRKVDAVLPEHDALILDALRTLSAPDVKTLRRLLEDLATANEDPD